MNKKKACELDLFWNSGLFDSFRGKDNLSINYAQFVKSHQQPSIVVSPGRAESYLKYKEVVFDLYKSGYNVFILDHRGQGLSERLLKNLHKGYVASFDDYADDLYTFIKTIICPIKKEDQPYLLAHSMGAAISLRMLQLYPTTVKKAALLSPMIAINTGILPRYIASSIIFILEKVNKLFTKGSWYFFGQSNYKAKPFSKNRVTHCEKRYEQCIDLYNKNKAIQLGGVTNHWLYEAFNSEEKIFSNIDKINTPISIFQACNDTIVSNKRQGDFCKKLSVTSPELTTKEPIKIQGAYHELLFEKDSIRSKTLNQIFDYFQE